MADGRHFKNRYIAISQQKSSDFDEILYTAEYFELDERHVINNKKSCIGQNPSSTEPISCIKEEAQLLQRERALLHVTE